MIVAEDAYEVAEPTINSHIVKMKSLNADVFVDITTPKFAAQAIRKAAEIGWRPLHFLNSVSTSIGAVIKPAGFENAQDIISVPMSWTQLDPQWSNDPGMKAFDEFLAKDFPEGNRADSLVLTGYNMAQTLVQVLKQCGDNLTRENVMKQAANLQGLQDHQPAARHQDQHQPDRFRADQASADQEVQGRQMGAIWAGPEQRNRRLNRLAYSSQAGDKLLPGHFLQVDAAPPLTHLRHRPIAADVRFGQSLFHNQMLRGRYRGRRGRGNGERQPRIPSRRTVGCTEFAVSPQAQGALHVSDREAVSDLRTDTENA